ncbi:hypothetical protein PV326_006333 [Microctonus aethiopoides]|nr:hypothetical protein PV326_006333 [Microctonus aethiopoides]
MSKSVEKSRSNSSENKIVTKQSSGEYSDIRSNDKSEEIKQLLPTSDDNEINKSLKKRWVALGLFGALACSQCCIWNTWGPIATSAMTAYPTWHKSSLALISNWGCITYLTCCLPCCWFLKQFNLSTALKVAATLTTIATFIRCVSSLGIILTTTAHLAAILNGLSGVIVGPATAAVSAIWFPIGERTTATGISSACGQLGVAMSYLLGPALVGNNPSHHLNVKAKNNNHWKTLDQHSNDIAPKSIEISGNNSNNLLTSDQILLRIQITSLMRIEFVIQFIVMLGILWFFPRQSEFSTSNFKMSTINFNKSLKNLIRNKSMWLLCLAAAFCQGMTGPWLVMITMAFGSTVTQDEADKLAFWTVIFSSILSLCATRIMDSFQGHLKLAIYMLLLTSTMMFLWIVLLDWRVLTFHKDELYAAVIIGIATSWSTPALFFELASEIAFPVSEAIVGGYLIFLSNIIGTTFYLSYIIPGMGGRLSTCLVFGNLIIATILIAYVKDDYNRTKHENELNQ